jgi:hypothetical protein
LFLRLHSIQGLLQDVITSFGGGVLDDVLIKSFAYISEQLLGNGVSKNWINITGLLRQL